MAKAMDFIIAAILDIAAAIGGWFLITANPILFWSLAVILLIGLVGILTPLGQPVWKIVASIPFIGVTLVSVLPAAILGGVIKTLAGVA